MTVPATILPFCPKCGGEMWDERKGKFWGNGKTKTGANKPIFKCKDKDNCDGVIWPTKNGQPPVAAAKPEGMSVGRLPGEEPEETSAPPVDPKVELFAAHSRCFKHVCDKYVPYAAEKGVELSLEGVSALTAQLWIELNKRGLA